MQIWRVAGWWKWKHRDIVSAQVFDNALPTPGLQAHVAVIHFADHLPYYRIEQMNARSSVHTPRSTLASWGGKTGVQLTPLYAAHRALVLASRILHAAETPVPLLDPAADSDKESLHVDVCLRAFDPMPGVVYDFCLGQGGKYPLEFLKRWSGTLVVDAYASYDGGIALPGRTAAYCFAHARRAFDEIIKTSTAASPIAAEAVRRIAWLYRIEADVRALSSRERQQVRQERSRPLWDGLHEWLHLQRARVPDGSAIDKTIDYSLNRWTGLGQFLLDGDMPLGRVEMWRGGSRSRHSCFRPFRLTVPYKPDRSSASTSPPRLTRHADFPSRDTTTSTSA